MAFGKLKFGEKFPPNIINLILVVHGTFYMQRTIGYKHDTSAVSFHAASILLLWLQIDTFLIVKVITTPYYIASLRVAAYYVERPASAAIEKKIDFLSASKWFGESYSLI